MKLSALTVDMVRRAIAIYQDLAYGTSRPRRPVHLPSGGEAAGQGGIEALLALFQKEQDETVPGYPCARYSMRLGNRNYPFMKLLLQEHLVAGEFFFAVDTHDQMEVKPEYPDYDQFMAVRRFNRELKRQIEQGFAAAGLATAAVVRQRLVAECGPAGEPCRGLVLIVDDEEDLAAAVEMSIRRRGFRTYTVHDGLSGLRAAQELLPDLVVLDYELPELDGLQVIQRLRAEPATERVPVLLSSAARVSLADIKRADGFLAKPFPEALLFEMIDRVLRTRGVRP
jgi:CheY-like chemotaxis protein